MSTRKFIYCLHNLRRYIFEDILIRTLLFNGYKVKHIINVTDVGHLTSDADEGEESEALGNDDVFCFWYK